MFDGILECTTLLLALAIVILVPGLATAALLLLVAAMIIGVGITRSPEDAKRSRERD